MWPFTAAGDMQCKRRWAQDVYVSADILETRLNATKARSADWTSADAAVEAGVRAQLEKARAATSRRDPVPGRLSNWWRGTLIEAAYHHLHAAESLIVALYSSEQVEADVPEAVARIDAGLPAEDPRHAAAHELLDGDLSESARRERLAKAIEIGFGAADAEHGRLRNFRNTVLSAAATLSVVLVVFGWYVSLNAGDVPFCFSPAGKAAVCASGASSPNGHDVVTVILIGSLGGMLAAVLAIKDLHGTSVPYDVPKALAILKLPLGALSAVGALIAIRGGFIPGFSDLDSQAQILAYAFCFGVAQQILTRLIDKQAQALLATAPGKASSAAQVRNAASSPVITTQTQPRRGTGLPSVAGAQS